MNIRIVAVGRIKERYLLDAIAEYKKRLTRFVKLEIVEVEDFPDEANAEIREGRLILPHLKGRVLLADPNGSRYTSPDFAALLDKTSAAYGQITLVIGGSNGVSSEVRQRADALVSFSDMTFPHRLFRVILLEQLYRAMTILKGVRYHK